MPEPDLDRRIRLEAFEHVLSLKSLHKTLPWEEIGRGFDFEGEKVHLSNRASGIHKPKQMDTLLSIRTARPRRGRQHWYEDQRQIQHEIFGEREYWNYSLMRGSPTLWRNRLLEEAYEQRTPIIYFLGVEPALYEPIVPAFIYSFDPIGRNCLVGPGDLRNTVEQVIDQRPFDSASERRYYMRETQQRAHQSIFRAAVLHAYRHRCAVTGLTVPRLLDAAHIVEDRHETLGQPVVPNGLPLSKIHHAAFDANLISIDPDYRIHISERLLDENDGPLLELLKQADGNRIYLPRQKGHYPDRNRLAMRYEQFRCVA